MKEVIRLEVHGLTSTSVSSPTVKSHDATLGLFEVCPPDALARCNNLDVVKTGMQAPKRVNTRIRLTVF
jgi:hypothetical protein